MKRSTLPIAALLLLAACGGGGEDAPSPAPVAAGPAGSPLTSGQPSKVPAAPPAGAAPVQTPAPATGGQPGATPSPVPGSPVAAPSPTVGDNPAGSPPAAGGNSPVPVPAAPAPAAPSPAPGTPAAPAAVTLPGTIAETQLVGSRGDPLYWSRVYAMSYNGGVIRIRPLATLPPGEEVEPEQQVIWQGGNILTQQHTDAATFSATTTDGRNAWLTVHRDGRLLGGGYHGTTSDSYLRIVPSSDVPTRPPQSSSFYCTGAGGFGPPAVTGFSATFNYNVGAFPWKSMAATQQAGSESVVFVVDPSGQRAASGNSASNGIGTFVNSQNERVVTLAGELPYQFTNYFFDADKATLKRVVTSVQPRLTYTCQ